jgi:hypothetical protein
MPCAEIFLCPSRCLSCLRLQFVDQDMTEPVDMRMQHIVSQLKQLQRNEAPAGNAKEWVACDDCQKWRKVPRGFHVDKDKNFYCNMLPKMSCEMKEEEWGKENDNSFIDAEWVLFSWDRFKRELAREKDKLDAAIRLVERSKANGNVTVFSPHQQPSIGDPLSPMNPEQEGRSMSEEQSASTESTSAELPEQLGVECAVNGVQAPLASAHAASAAASAVVEKAALLVRTQMECISKWKVEDNVEAKDSTGRWYRAQVRGVSYTGRQVKINFGAWDSKWDEWIRIKEGRVRDIQFPEALRIKVDGTPIWPKDKKKKDVDEMEMEEVDEGERVSATPAKLTREEQRSMERMRRLEEEEKRRRKKEEREKAGPSAYKIFIAEESARLMKEQKGLKMIEANQLARDEWKKRTLVAPEIPMGIIIGSAHQLYACLDEETVQDVAAKLKVDAHKLLSMNVAVYPGMKMKDKLMEGTLLKLPLREGSGDSEKTIKVMCKVQAVKNILMLSMKENETIMALKKRVSGKENIKVGLQTVVFSGQRLEDQHTLADYNISDETLVVIHVGSQTHAVDSSKGAQEIEYDSSWMLSPAGKRFMETKEGQAWLKTKAGLEWQKQKKEDEREERKEAVRESKITQEAEPGAALKRFNLWFKTETALLREKHPHMSQKMASDTARWTWKVYAGEFCLPRASLLQVLLCMRKHSWCSLS